MRSYSSLRELARDWISEAITSGRLSPGDHLTEQDIADSLHISRTPAREALMFLWCEDVLEFVPRKGYMIKNVSRQEVLEMYEMIALLDAHAAVLACPGLVESDFDSMAQTASKIDLAIRHRNLDDYRAEQHEFHDIYRRRCGNRVLTKFLRTLESGLAPLIYEYEDDDKRYRIYAATNREHRRIIGMFRRRDTETLFRFLKDEHWRSTREPDAQA